MFNVGRFVRYRGSTQQFSRGGRRPYRTWARSARSPSAEALGYWRAFLRNWGPDGLKLERIRHFYTEIFLSCIQVF